MGTCVHFSRSLPSNSWWQTMVGCQVLSRPSAAEGGGRRPAFTGPATQPYSATEVDGWQQLNRVSQNRAAVHSSTPSDRRSARLMLGCSVAAPIAEPSLLELRDELPGLWPVRSGSRGAVYGVPCRALCSVIPEPHGPTSYGERRPWRRVMLYVGV